MSVSMKLKDNIYKEKKKRLVSLLYMFQEKLSINVEESY